MGIRPTTQQTEAISQVRTPSHQQKQVPDTNLHLYVEVGVEQQLGVRGTGRIAR